GTPQYTSPEQADGKPVDHRSDLFSLGSVLYACCTGRSPFRAGSAMAALRHVCDDTPRPIREINPEVPEWLCAIIGKLHAKDPAGRFQTAAEVAELLGKHLAQLQQPALPAGGAQISPGPEGREADRSEPRVGERPRGPGDPIRPFRHRWIFLVAVAFLFL